MNTQVTAFGIVCFELFKIASLDAQARGLSHPRLWGLLAASGNNSAGLIMYLISRRKYPVINMSEEMIHEIESRKKRAGAGILFLALGAIGSVITIALI